ncbi:DNA-binding transcriptional LysR family regulator [Aequitasia blattaphilus]|uniref:LysR family transcriptional regulator n=1 Tax=Aequitasia blattaphilus TaxID=2949332 RepID=A0ABT1E558_9FIRM|nr:LysR family transcriptional regulator [Aequitasia blattaphilus]MCP1100841.1 LysR family transcriptional regulator [Aequitasia blattaphilus]MCR8613481.1 LysR family transcriptional regulator [Aequitasia blattaphilus]
MNLYHLRYFVALAHLEHYTKAAEQLMITQPSLSHAISSIEEELGVKLFEKAGRNIALTKCGRSFLLEVEASLRILDSSINNLKLVGKGEGVIEIGFLRTLGSDLVPRLIKGFLDQNPNSNIDFHISGDNGLTPDLLTGLKDRVYDLVLCSKMENEPLIDFTPFSKQDLVVAVPSNHPLADQTSIHLEETLPYPHIFFRKRSGLRSIIDKLFRSIGHFPEIAYEIEEDQVVAGFVSHGFGIAVIPNMPLLSHMDIKAIPLISPVWERNFYIATLKNTYVAPAAQAFKQYILDNAQ